MESIFQKKTEMVRAWRFHSRSAELPRWMQAALMHGMVRFQGGGEPALAVEVGDGQTAARLGDWIVFGPDSRMQALTNEEFWDIYEGIPNVGGDGDGGLPLRFALA